MAYLPKSLAAAGALGLALAFTPATANAQVAQPGSAANIAKAFDNGLTQNVQYRHYRRYGGNPYYGRGGPYYYHRDRYRARRNAAIGLGAGLATGAIIGGAIAAQQNRGPVVRDLGPDGSASYCAQRYRSYDPASGTYLGYDGVRRSCP